VNGDATAQQISFSRAVRELGADLDPVLESLDLAIYLIDRSGTFRWLNDAAIALWGDKRGTRAILTAAPEFRHRAQQSLARQLLGLEGTVELESIAIGPDGRRIPVRVNRITLTGERGVVGVLGTSRVLSAGTNRPTEVELTPRQHETLRLLAGGSSTDEIAAELGVARETARNYIRQLLRALGVHSRLEAVVRARELDLV
jgi:DNA-binding CsgD family transcriptional regulator